MGFYLADNVLLHGSGFIIKNGNILYGEDLIPLYIKDQISAGSRWDFSYKTLETEYIDEKCLVICSDAHKIYGHWLVDILPRLWLYQRFVQDSNDKLKIVLPSDVPDFARRILSDYFGIKNCDIRFFTFPENNVRLRSAVIPSLLHNSHHFHPAINLFAGDMIKMAFQVLKKEAVSCPMPSRLYISRTQFREKSTSYSRALANDDAIMDLVKRFDFSIVYPESMTWAEQIALFSRARIIVGEAGSGLHNAIFSPQCSTIICLNPQNHVQGSIAAVRNQNIFYACADEDNSDSSQFTISCDKLQRLIERSIFVDNNG